MRRGRHDVAMAAQSRQLNIGTGSCEACIRRSDASGYWSECLSLAAGSGQNAAHANHRPFGVEVGSVIPDYLDTSTPGIEGHPGRGLGTALASDQRAGLGLRAAAGPRRFDDRALN